MKVKYILLVAAFSVLGACNRISDRKYISPEAVISMEIVSDHSRKVFYTSKIEVEYNLRFLFRYFVEHDMFYLALKYGGELYDLRQTSTPVNEAEQKELEMLLVLCELAIDTSTSYNLDRLKRLADEGVPFAAKSLAIASCHLCVAPPASEADRYASYLKNRDEDIMFAIQIGDKNTHGKVLKRYVQGLIVHHYSMAKEGARILYPSDGKSDNDRTFYKSGPLRGAPLRYILPE